MKSSLEISILIRSAFSLLTAFALVSGASAQLRVGTARVEITPPVPADNQGPTGKYDHEHIYVRAIVVDNGKTRAALIGADQSNMPVGAWKPASEQIAKDLNCPVPNILMSATHTHSPGEPIGPGTPESQKRLADAIVQAVHEAKGKLQPAQMAFGTGMAYLNVNRDAINPETHLWTQAK